MADVKLSEHITWDALSMAPRSQRVKVLVVKIWQEEKKKISLVLGLCLIVFLSFIFWPQKASQKPEEIYSVVLPPPAKKRVALRAVDDLCTVLEKTAQTSIGLGSRAKKRCGL